MLPLGPDLVVLPAKWNDPHVPRPSCERGDSIRVQPRTGHQTIARMIARRAQHAPPRPVPPNPMYTRIHDDFPAPAADLFHQFAADLRVVGDSLFRHPNRRQSRGVRFDLAQFVGREEPQVSQTVLLAALEQRAQSGNFVIRGRHDDLPADLVRNGMRLAEFHHLTDSPHREPGFPRTRFIVEPRMQNAAVVAALMPPDVGFFLDHRDLYAAARLAEAVSRRQPYDATADHDDALVHIVIIRARSSGTA